MPDFAQRDTIFKPKYGMRSSSDGAENDSNPSMDLGSNFNVGLAHFFSLPKLDKQEA